MKKLLAVLSPVLAFLPLSCSGNSTKIMYTKLDSCTESISNPNDAASVLNCPKIGPLSLDVTTIGPDFFYIELKSKDINRVADFAKTSNDLPMNPGKVIEWHLHDQKPKYMIFRISWGAEDAPFIMKEFLTVNLVAKDKICPLAIIDVKTNNNANQKARNLIQNELKDASTCPKSPLLL